MEWILFIGSPTLEPHELPIVQDPAGAPIPDASVNVLHWEAPTGAKPRLLSDGVSVTDKEGRETFAVIPREYEVHASAIAFVPAVRSVRVARGGQDPYTFTLSIQRGGGVEVEGPRNAK